MAKSLVNAEQLEPAFATAFASIQASSPCNLPAFLLAADDKTCTGLFPVGPGGADVPLSFPYQATDKGVSFDWSQRHVA